VCGDEGGGPDGAGWELSSVLPFAVVMAKQRQWCGREVLSEGLQGLYGSWLLLDAVNYQQTRTVSAGSVATRGCMIQVLGILCMFAWPSGIVWS
jgi:hypothetical protein